jgi:hypothetical protein|tara:strand:- start:506 stop:706 length:201 start_codon:yes stop_codon:yes gene_type:complete
MELAIIVGVSIISLLLIGTLFTLFDMSKDLVRVLHFVETMKFEFVKLNEPMDMWDTKGNFNGFNDE